MARAVVLLRGVNVGGNNMIRMPVLTGLLEGLGCTDVVTYLQSGNAVVTSSLRPAGLEAAVREALVQTGLDVRVMVRTARDLDAVVAANPFPDAEPKLLHVAFLSGDPVAVPEATPPEAVVAGPACSLYVHYANGVRGSKLTLSDNKLGVAATARNWRTVLALQSLLRGEGQTPTAEKPPST